MKSLKELRIEKGMTQTDVAIAVGCSLASYRMWEMGVTTPNSENAQRLKEVLGYERKEGA